MARTVRDMDKPEEAAKILKVVLDLEPGNPDALLVQGVLNEQIGDRKAAASSFKEAIHSSPDMTVAHYYLSQIKGRAGTDDEYEAMKALDANAELTFDAELGYEVLDGLELAVGAQNMFDNYPIENPYSGIVGAKYGERSPFGFNGGSYYLRARFQW